MQNIFYKGENIIVKWNVVDKTNSGVSWSLMDDVTVVVTDKSNKSVTYKKSLGTIVQGDLDNQIRFEITEAHTQAFASGKLRAKFTYKIVNAEFASGFLIDTIEEGVNSEFITLQN